MIVAFVGTIDEDESALPITGNGKTCAMTGFSYNDFVAGKEIWSNFQTDYSKEIIGFQTMINRLEDNVTNNKINPDIILAVTEIRRIIDAVGSTTEQILYIDNFVEQIRKMECVLYYDTQRFNSVHKRLRIHTNVILIPYKTHFDESACYLPSCMKPHKIYVYSHKPYRRNPVACFDSIETGRHYDTKEFCKDKLVLPKRPKGVY
jgi:hypothetical protein